MADGEVSAPRKHKVDAENDQIFEKFLKQNVQTVKKIQGVVAALKYGFNSCQVRTLKVDKANVCSSVPFTKASIHFQKNEKINENQFATIGAIFRKAYIVLDDYIHSDPEKGDPKLPESPEERNALGLLLKYVENLEKESKLLSKELQFDVNEWCWTLKLTQHVFSKLSLDPGYIYDVQKCLTCTGCPCPEQDELFGWKGDTSFGWEEGWHGKLDVLIGGDAAIIGDFDKPDDLPSPSLSSTASDSSLDTEVKHTEAFSGYNYCQIFSKTITFSFLKNKDKPNMTLIPTVAVNRDYMQVHFYDSEKDVLLQSGCFGLFLETNILNIIAVTVIWMTLNYKIFCTGSVEGMPSSSFHKLINVHDFKEGVKSPCCVKKKIDQSWVWDKCWTEKVIPKPI